MIFSFSQTRMLFTRKTLLHQYSMRPLLFGMPQALSFFLLPCSWLMDYGIISDYVQLFSLQKAKKSYQKDLENSQRNVDGDTSAAPGDGCVWFSCFCI